MILGLQGPNGVTNDPDKVMACAKHYAGYSETQSGRDASEAELSKRKLKSWFLPPFQNVTTDPKVGSYMVSYQSIDDIPATANHWLLTEMLNETWGYNGFLATDYNNIRYMIDNQGVATNYEQAVALAINAGNDMIMATPRFYEGALRAVRNGKEIFLWLTLL